VLFSSNGTIGLPAGSVNVSAITTALQN